jgi:peptidoglycan/LPS O-acetylase OafA/YrhL
MFQSWSDAAMMHGHDRDHSAELEVAPTSGPRLSGVEGLRAAAAMSVMLGHFNLHLVPREMVPPALQHALNVAGQGLTLFFVLSGFLLFGPFIGSAARGTPFDVSKYFLNRFLRIYPAYFTIFAIVALALGLAYTRAGSAGDLGVQSVAGTIGRMTDFWPLAANFLLVHTLTPWTIKTGLGVSWSLTAEVCFYLLLPLLAAAALRMSRRTGLSFAAAAVSLGMIVVGLACRNIGNAQVHGDEAAQFYQQWGGNWLAVYLRSILCQADFFGVGMLAVVAFRHGSTIEGVIARRRYRWLTYAAALSGMALTRLDHDFGFAVFFASLLLIVTTRTAASRRHPLTSLLEWAPVRWLGVISYSFYLWHLPVIWGVYKWLLQGEFPGTPGGIAISYAAVLALTTALASATYLAIERPALLLKARPGRTGKLAPASWRRRMAGSAAEVQVHKPVGPH